MGGVAAATWPDRPLGDQQAAAIGEYPAGLGEPCLPVGPVMNRAQRPDHGGARVGQRKVFSAALEPRDVAGAAAGADPAGQRQAGRAGIDARRGGRMAGGCADGGAGAAPHVHNAITAGEPSDPDGRPGGSATPGEHGRRAEPGSHTVAQ